MPQQIEYSSPTVKRPTKAKPSPTEPRYIAMASELRERISLGELQPGDRLPSFSEMRSQHGSTVATVERVYGVLEREGLVERRQGIGTFVTAPKRVQTGNIGLLGCAISKSQRMVYYAHLMDGVQSALEEHSKHLLSLGAGESWSREAVTKVDGVLLSNLGQAEHTICELPPGMPRVSMLTTAEGVTSVVADEYGGAKLALEHLLALGHRRIACLMEQMPPQPRLRMAAYNDTLIQAGITPDPRWICRTQADISNVPAEIRQTYQEWGYNSMKAWLESNWAETGCTAIFVQNDTAAVGVLQALQEVNIKVPSQVSVIGFDGTEVCDYSNPRLTAVEVPLVKIGAKAVELLLKQIEAREKAQDAHVIVLPTRIKEGDSTGPAPIN
jgi:DNA-binding LacI/PurR family transcriptional regulator